MIDLLQDDVPTLRACSLTCSLWLTRSRFHLFSRIRITDHTSLASFVSLLQAQPYLQYIVTSVAIHISHNTPTSIPTLQDVAPIVLVGHLPCLGRLSFQQHILFELTFLLGGVSFRRDTLACLDRYGSVRDLQLGPLDMRTGAELVRLLVMLPGLRNLSCTKVQFVRRGPGTDLAKAIYSNTLPLQGLTVCLCRV